MPTAQLDLLVVADSTQGGLGAAAVAHAEWFAGQGWLVALAAPGADETSSALVRRLTMSEVRTAMHPRSVLSAATDLRKMMRDTRPRIVHAQGTRSQLLVLLAGRRPFVTMHGSGGRVSGQSRLGAAVRASARRLAARLSVQPFSAAPARGGWQTLLHASPRLAGLTHVPVPVHDVPVFVFVGRLDAPKRADLFVEAVAQASRVRAVRGIVVGDGPLRSSIEAAVQTARAPVKVVGQVADPTPYLHEATAVCLFSDFEGVPFTVQEALWVGRPVVLSDLPSLRWFTGPHGRFAATADQAARHLLELCEPGVAAQEGEAAATAVRAVLRADAPFPALAEAYERWLSTAR